MSFIKKLDRIFNKQEADLYKDFYLSNEELFNFDDLEKIADTDTHEEILITCSSGMLITEKQPQVFKKVSFDKNRQQHLQETAKTKIQELFKIKKEKEIELEAERKKRKKTERQMRKIEKHKNTGFYKTSKSLEFARFSYSDKDKEFQLELFAGYPDFKKNNPCILGLHELSKTETHALEVILELFSRTQYKGNLQGDYITVTGIKGEEKIFSPKLRIPLQKFLVNCDVIDTAGKSRQEFINAINKLSNSNYFMYWRIKENKEWKIYRRKDSLIKLAFLTNEEDNRETDIILELSPIALYLENNYICKPVGFTNKLKKMSPKDKKPTQYNFTNYLLLQAYSKNTKGKTRLNYKLDTIIQNLFLEEELKKQGLKYVVNKLTNYCNNISELGFLTEYEIDTVKRKCLFVIDKKKIADF